MIFDAVFVIFVLTALIAGSLTDLRKREVPNWINYTLLASIFLLLAVQSILTYTILPILFGIFGLIFAYIIGAIMYYSGQWGGGDAKMLMAISPAFATYSPMIFQPDYAVNILRLLTENEYLISQNILFLPFFVINIFIFGAIYGLIWTGFLFFRHTTECLKTYRELRKKHVHIMYISYALLLGLPLSYLFTDELLKIALIFIPTAFFILVIMGFIVKSIEKTCFIQKMHVKDLTEGEWVVEDVFVKNKRICGPKDLGITNEQIVTLKKHKIQNVLVKIGIPFIPAFLFGFLFTIIIGNPLILFIPFL
ncbi:MAG: prepilin peptidase [Candidatus Woesearchaeota archaeon]